MSASVYLKLFRTKAYFFSFSFFFLFGLEELSLRAETDLYT